MNRFIPITATLAFGLFTSVAFAAPKFMTTHNLSNVQTNAFVDGVPGPAPTNPDASSQVSWMFVKIGCKAHAAEGICPAVIMMATNTPAPIELGTVYVNLESGDITPSRLSGGGYTLTVNGPGEITVSND
jgi:hypothetical protein